MKRLIPIVIVIGLLWAMLVSAQDIEPTTGNVNPGANITFPPPVYSVRGGTPIRGTANLPDMTNYYLEFRPLIFGVEETDDTRPWFPISLPTTTAVTDGILAVWNTRTTSDGLYEIRLTVNVSTGDPQYFRVSPVRVENDIETYGQYLIPPLSAVLGGSSSDFVPTAVPFTATPDPAAATATDIPVEVDEVVTTTSVEGARVVALVDSNVRQGDDVSTPFIGALLTGESATVIGISSRNTGWYYIELANGRRGFIAPGIVDTENLPDDLPRITPPLPAANPTPISDGPNLHLIRFDLNPNPPRCDETFEIIIGVENNGTERTGAGEVLVYDEDFDSKTETVRAFGDFPELNPDESYEVVIEVSIDTFFDEEHEVWVIIDHLEEVTEVTRGDNIATQRFTLRQGECLRDDDDDSDSDSESS